MEFCSNNKASLGACFSIESTENDQLFSVDGSVLKEGSNGDCLMSIINSDISFAPAFDFLDMDDQCFSIPAQEMSSQSCNANIKTSPWHESDSGVSESFSVLGSPQSLEDTHRPPDGIGMAVSNTDVTTVSPGLHSDNEDVDDDLMNYLCGDGQLFPSEVPKESVDVILSPNDTKSQTVKKCNAEVQSHKNVDSGDSETDSEDRRNQTDQSLDYFSHHTNFPSRYGNNDIKIVRVVKPTSSQMPSTDDIMNALDERSKKNAKQAKLNREKKKAYVNGLEKDVENLRRENTELRKDKDRVKDEMLSLEKEVEYLKSVLANASALSGLLKNINNVQSVSLSSSMTSRKRRSAEDDHNYNVSGGSCVKRSRFVKENLKKAGVCLHVSDGNASLEFCSHCSNLANKSFCQL